MTATKLSWITGRSRSDESKLTLSVYYSWNEPSGGCSLANHETAVGIYNQQTKHWNKVPQAPLVSLHKYNLFSSLLTCCSVTATVISADKKKKLVLMSTDHQKHSKQAKSAPEGDLSLLTATSECSGSSLLERILTKCKSSSNAVNNNHQVTTNVNA